MNTPLRLILILAVLLLGGSIASAQGLRAEPPVTVRVTSPANNATVGRTVTFTGTAKAGIGLSVLIDGDVYIPVQDRGTTEDREYAASGTADGNGRFSFTINLNGQAVQEAEGAAKKSVSAGRHEFVVTELYAQDAGQSAPIMLTVSDSEQAATAEETETATPTPTPTPSPSASPLAADAADKSDWPKLLLAGALGGLTAYGLHRLYYRKRRKK